jgi:TolA-binding protein
VATQSQIQQAGSAPIDRLLALAQTKRRQFTIVGAVMLVVAGGFWFARASRENKIAFAARELRNAQSAIVAGNTALAINDLSRLVNTYGGTPAAGEAALLLGQLRMSRGEVDVAITELRAFLDQGPDDRFRAPAYGLLGSALEQAGKVGEAAEAYGQAAETWPYSYLRAQSLLDAARAFRLSGDTAQAAQSYERILRDFADSPSALEAELRLGEVRKGRGVS